MAIKSPLPDQHRKTTSEALQGALIDLLDLSLVAKQVHWNLIGRNFRSVHLQLDEVVAIARQYSDAVAERAAAIGTPPDGRAATIASASELPRPDAGWIKDTDGVRLMVDALDKIVSSMRQRVQDTDEADLASQDLFLDITLDLEKQSWMFQAQLD